MHEINNITIAFFFLQKLNQPLDLYGTDLLDLTLLKSYPTLYFHSPCVIMKLSLFIIPFKVVAVLEQVLLCLCC